MELKGESHCLYCKNDWRTCSKNKYGDGLINIIVTGTERCNKRCSYCWHFDRLGSQKMLQDMDESHVDELLDMLEWQFPGHNISYQALGGEPTMNIPMFDYLVGETLRRRGNVHCFMITNGKAYVDEMIEFMQKYRNIRVQVSLPETHEEITTAIKRYIRLQDAQDIRFSYVVMEHELDSLKDTLRYYKKLGIRKLFLNFEFKQGPDFKINNKERYREKIFEAFDYYVNELKDFNFEIENLAQMDYTYEMIFEGDQMPPGYTTYTLDYFADKNLYATHFVNSRPVGNTRAGINKELVQKIDKYKNCESCKYTKMCMLNRALFVTADLKYDVNPEACFPYITTADYVLDKIGVTL